jgi:hypothetical protein
VAEDAGNRVFSSRTVRRRRFRNWKRSGGGCGRSGYYRFAFEGPVVTVGKVNRNQIMRHDFSFSCNDLRAGGLPRLHDIVVRETENRQLLRRRRRVSLAHGNLVEDGRGRRRRLRAERSGLANQGHSGRTRVADRPVRHQHTQGTANLHFGCDPKSGGIAAKEIARAFSSISRGTERPFVASVPKRKAVSDNLAANQAIQNDARTYPTWQRAPSKLAWRISFHQLAFAQSPKYLCARSPRPMARSCCSWL